MKLLRFSLLASLTLALSLAVNGAVRAETKIELKGVHLCCGQCVKAVDKVLKSVDGVTGMCDKDAKTVSITAKDDAAAKKVLQALADAGFQGDTGNKDLAMKDDSGAPKGKVKSITLTGTHNCCGNCNTAIQKTLKSVPGVKENTAKAKASTFEVTGDFDAAELVKALNDAGFHVKVKK